jgi:hypothetical protein
MLRKHFCDPERQITMEPITIEQDLTFEVRLVRFLEESEPVMRNRTLKVCEVPLIATNRA